MKTYLFTFCLALLLSMAVTPLVVAWAKRHHWVDEPGTRKVHKVPVARLGGVGIFVGTLLAILPALLIPNRVGEQLRMFGGEILVVLLGAAIIFTLGLYDDLRHARVRTKLGVELAVAVVVCIAGVRIQHITIQGLFSIPLGWTGYVITVFWIVGITNAMNLIDGLDGLAAGLAAIACGVVAVLSVIQANVILAVMMMALLGSLTGFLLFNFHPARIFMGDCGSLFLGFMIATASVLTASKSEALVGFGLPILVLGIPIFDTLFSILRRFTERRGIMSPDRAHFHHRLLDLGLTQNQAVIVAYLITILITGLGLFMLMTRSRGSLLILLSCLILLLLVFRLTGAVHLRETLAAVRRRSELAHHKFMEQRQFEEAQLYLSSAKTFDEWWGYVCKAGKALGCARISLNLATADDSHHDVIWEKGREENIEKKDGEVMHLCILVSGLKEKRRHKMEIDMLTEGSLEGAGRRATLLVRLAEEQGLDSLLSKGETNNAI